MSKASENYTKRWQQCKMTTSIKYLFFHLILISIIGFWVYMTFLTLERGSLKEDELKVVGGEIEEKWKFVHKSGPNRNGVYSYDTIQAFRVSEHDQSFGISVNRKFYNDFERTLKDNPKVYLTLTYNPNGKKIEHETTLHIFSLTTASDKFITLEETKRSERTGTLVFGCLAILFLIFYSYGIKKMKKNKTLLPTMVKKS